MSSSAGLPQTPPQRPPLRRGVKEAIIALAALPVLLVAGYVGGRIADGGSSSLQPAVPVAGPGRTPVPLVTVQPSTPGALVTVKPAAPAPLVTVKPATPAPQVSVRPRGPTTAAPNPPATPAAKSPRAPQTVAGPVAPTSPPAVPSLLLGRGSTGADVRAWQKQMARRHWRIAVDGIFGAQTQRVAREFQLRKGLRVDGVVGRETWNAAWRLPVIL